MTGASSAVVKSRGMAAFDRTGPLKPHDYEIRPLGSKDVQMAVRYSGICHSDIHQARGEWPEMPPIYPMVPGHEIIGQVEKVGTDVTKFKAGDWIGVGCFVDSCHNCRYCNDHEENHCSKGVVWSYNCKGYDGKPTYGGYGKYVVCDEHFVVRIPDEFGKDPEKIKSVPPLLCAGITCWTPMIRHNMCKPGQKMGVVGLGGLGHVAVKLGVAFGMEVTVISTSEKKKEEALGFGATKFIVSRNKEEMDSIKGTLDFIIDTVSSAKPMQPYLDLLGIGGVLCSVALPPEGSMIEVAPFSLVAEKKILCGSLVGGVKATEEMLEFCAKKNVLPVCEFIKPQQVNEAYDRTVKSDVRYRFVIDMTQDF